MIIRFLMTNNYLINQSNIGTVSNIANQQITETNTENEKELAKNKTVLKLSYARALYFNCVNAKKENNQKEYDNSINDLIKLHKELCEEDNYFSPNDFPENADKKGFHFDNKNIPSIKACFYTYRLLKEFLNTSVEPIPRGYRNPDPLGLKKENWAIPVHEKIMRYQKPMNMLWEIFRSNAGLPKRLEKYEEKLKLFEDNNYVFNDVDYYDIPDNYKRIGAYPDHTETSALINGKTTKIYPTVSFPLNENEKAELKKVIELQLKSMINNYEFDLKEVDSKNADLTTEITKGSPSFKKGSLLVKNIEFLNTAIAKAAELKSINEQIEALPEIKKLLNGSTTNYYEKAITDIEEKINQCIGAENKYFKDITDRPDAEKLTSFYLDEYRTKTNILEYQKLLNKIGAPISKLVAERIGKLDETINEIEKKLFSEEYKTTISLINKINNTKDMDEKKKIAAGINKTTYESLKEYINDNTQYHDLYEARKGKLPGGFISFKNKKPGEGEDDKSGKGLVPSIN